MAVWKKAVPGLNYHISVEKQNYSVPSEYARRPVDVRVTETTVEVFYEGCRICSHLRLHGKPGQYSTNVEHMPKAHQEYIQWDGKRFRSWAEKIGKNTETVVDSLLKRGAVEQQGYRSCMSLLKLSDKYSPERLEAACGKALKYTTRPSYKNVSEILKSGLDKTESMKSNEDAYGFVRGATYFGDAERKNNDI